jgi:ankyrin repeat protein
VLAIAKESAQPTARSSIDVSAVDPRGRTALHRAERLGRMKFMDVLVSAGVPLDAMDISGFTAFDLAVGDVAIRTALMNESRKP